MCGVNSRSQLDDPRLRISLNGCGRKKRTWILIQGVSPRNTMGVFNNTIDTLSRALLERYYQCEVSPGVFEPPLKPQPRAFKRLKLFEDSLISIMPYVFPVSSRLEVVEMYHGSKRRVYQRAYESTCSKRCCRDDARLVGFSKFEKTDINKACRCINPRDPRYNLELARYLKRFEKCVYKYIGKLFGHPTVIKGYNSYDSARLLREKWDSFEDPVAVGLDAKKFDMHVSKEALQFEHNLYNRVYRSKKLKRLLSWQIRNSGWAFTQDGQLEYSITGTRSSGDINTALGNCYLMCAMIWELCRSLAIRTHLANNGDDCVVFMNRSDLRAFIDAVPGYFEELGFRMKIEQPVDEFECIEFCQTNPVFNGERYCMVRNPRTCLIKDAMCIHAMAGDGLRKWLWAVGECGGMLNAGIPVLQSFYRAYRRSGIRCNLTEHVFRGEGRLVLAKGLTLQDRKVTSDARVSFWRAFGVSPDAQVDLECYFDRLSIGPLEEGIYTHEEMDYRRDYIEYPYSQPDVFWV